jgi:hypothetical protein
VAATFNIPRAVKVLILMASDGISLREFDAAIETPGKGAGSVVARPTQMVGRAALGL